MSKQVMLDIGSKAVEQIGKHQLWLVPRHLRRQPSPLSGDAVRECLRSLGIFILDANFESLTSAYGGGSTAAGEFDLDRFLNDFTAAVLNHRRRHVVNLVLKKLDPDRTGLVEMNRMCDCYDVLRHPAVLGGIRDADDVAAEFFDTFREDEEGADDGVALTCEELIYYYCGLSLVTEKDEELELRCIRSFCLDRPKLNTEEDAARMAGSRAVSRQSRLLGEGRNHPLYTTTNEDYGSTAKDVPKSPIKHGRSQKFTSNMPPRSGGATSMNM